MRTVLFTLFLGAILTISAQTGRVYADTDNMVLRCEVPMSDFNVIEMTSTDLPGQIAVQLLKKSTAGELETVPTYDEKLQKWVSNWMVNEQTLIEAKNKTGQFTMDLRDGRIGYSRVLSVTLLPLEKGETTRHIFANVEVYSDDSSFSAPAFCKGRLIE